MMRTRSRYTQPRIALGWGGIVPITNPRDIPASVYRDAILPELPTPQRKGIIDEWFTLSTHILPAAFPRSGPDVPYPEGCDADGLVVPEAEGGPDAARKARKDAGIKASKALYEINKKHWLGELPGYSTKPLWVCVNRFVRKVPVSREQERGRRRVTLLLAHGNGLGKECWEAVLMHMVLHNKSEDPIIDEIWSWDPVNQGDSALINKQNLGAFHEWLDDSRDMINFLTHYLPENIGYSGDELPTHLPLISQEISKGRATNGLTSRTLVGIGYSYGGCTQINAARLSPQLFSALVLVDPAIYPAPVAQGMRWADGWDAPETLVALCDGVISRRNGWESKTEASHSFADVPFFATWDPVCLELYVECQLWEDKEAGEIRLKMSGTCECSVFAGLRGPFEGWDMLPLLDDRVTLKFILPEEHFLGLKSGPYIPFLRPKNSSHVIIMGTSHLLCLEAPFDIGDEILSFLRNQDGPICQAKL